MSLANLHTLTDSASDPNSEFKQLRYNILSLFEGNIPTPYFDSKGIITIGIGFNIDLQSNRSLVLDTMGLTAQQAAITAAWNSSTMVEIRALPQATSTQLWAKNATLRAYLDNVLGTQAFSMTPQQTKDVFDVLVKEHQDAISSLVGTPSLEQIILTSLHYNSPGLIGPGLSAALAMSDPNEARAEAWYQIRYGHVPGQSDARRYAEAALFGIFGQGQNGSTLEEATAAYRMYSKHNDADEMLNFDNGRPSAFATANNWLSTLGYSSSPAQPLEYTLESAATSLIDKYASGKTIKPLNIWVNPKEGGTSSREGKPRENEDNLLIGDAGVDGLIGGSGNDVLIGNGSADILRGNGGDDILIGGDGTDTYIYATGDGSDTIIDYVVDGYGGDGKGGIQFDGTGLSGGTGGDSEGEIKQATKAGTFKSDDKKYKYDWGGEGSDLIINGTITVKNFHNGVLGITLNERKKKPPVAENVSSLFNSAQSFIQRLYGDPLTLDLNSDGINTIPLTTPPILFDHTGSGIKTGTGWIAPDDGFLVLDRNGNGAIDNGTELFGDSTPILDANGNITGKAKNGFDALAQLDTNHDGIVDAQDSNFSSLQVWQDLNQDGISQASELTSLTDLGITSINVGATQHSQMLPSGKEIVSRWQVYVANDMEGRLAA
jgi:hypothetical protein